MAEFVCILHACVGWHLWHFDKELLTWKDELTYFIHACVGWDRFVYHIFAEIVVATDFTLRSLVAFAENWVHFQPKSIEINSIKEKGSINIFCRNDSSAAQHE